MIGMTWGGDVEEQKKNPILERAIGAKNRLVDEEYDRRRFAGEYTKFLFIGGVNTLVFFSFYTFVYIVNPLKFSAESYIHTFAYGIAWFLCSIEAHMLHRRVTFGKSKTKYFESLFWSQLVYITIGSAATISGFFLVNVFELNHWVSWIVQSCVFGPMNFIGLRLVAFYPELEEE